MLCGQAEEAVEASESSQEAGCWALAAPVLILHIDPT